MLVFKGPRTEFDPISRVAHTFARDMRAKFFQYSLWLQIDKKNLLGVFHSHGSIHFDPSFQPRLTTTAPIVTKFFLLWITWSLAWQEQNCQVSESHEDPLRIYRALKFSGFHCFRHKKSSFFLTDVSTWCQQFHEIFKTK